MVIIYSLIVASLIVAGQALWKAAVTDVSKHDTNILSYGQILNLITSPKLILGVIVYALATFSYIYLLSKYDYFQLQSIVVGSSIIFTLLIATVLFGEKPTILNILGVTLIIIGSAFVFSK